MSKKLDQWAISLVYEYGRFRERLLSTDIDDTQAREPILERLDTIEILLKDNYGINTIAPTKLS
jgi:hypothetical protein